MGINLSREYLGLDLRMDTKKTCMLKNSTTCAECGNYCRSNSLHNWENLHDLSIREYIYIITLTMSMILIQAS